MTAVDFDWDEALSEIFESRLMCPRCSTEHEVLVVGYSAKPALSRYAPRHRDCAEGDQCQARKLITLCVECARLERLRGEARNAVQVLETYMFDCRRELDSSLDYVAEDWRDDYELSEDQLDESLEVVDPHVFDEHRARRRELEEEYLHYHREFRARNRRVPEPGWRSEHVEEVVNLGYETLLGD